MDNAHRQSLYLDALLKMEEALDALKRLKAAEPMRELAVAQTNAETAQLWLMASEHAFPGATA